MIHKKMLDENIKKHKRKVVYLFLSLKIFINFFKIQKMTAKNRGIVLRHKVSERMVDVRWSEVQGGAMVSFKGEEFLIRQGVCKRVDCRIQCTKCGICMHAYTCTCRDYNLHLTICKHINFFVGRQISREERAVSTVKENHEEPTDVPRTEERFIEKPKNLDDFLFNINEALKALFADYWIQASHMIKKLCLLSKENNQDRQRRGEFYQPTTSCRQPANKNVTPQNTFTQVGLRIF